MGETATASRGQRIITFISADVAPTWTFLTPIPDPLDGLLVEDEALDYEDGLTVLNTHFVHVRGADDPGNR